MENNKNISPAKLPEQKRRSRPRRATTQDRIINVAEARKEIALALQLHRSASSSSCVHYVAENKNPSSISTTSLLGNNITYNLHDFDDHKSNNNNIYSCYSLMESMPVPEPTWSTTAPSVLAASLESKDLEVLDQYLGDQNEASSYSWWVGFLKSLDENHINLNMNNNKISDPKCSMGKSRVSNELVDKSNCGTTDEWLSFPTAEDGYESETNNIHSNS